MNTVDLKRLKEKEDAAIKIIDSRESFSSSSTASFTLSGSESAISILKLRRN
jgi:hypothetical protein